MAKSSAILYVAALLAAFLLTFHIDSQKYLSNSSNDSSQFRALFSTSVQVLKHLEEATGGGSSNMSLLNSCGRAFTSLFLEGQPTTYSQKSRRAKRRVGMFETLENRMLMSVTQDAGGWTIVEASEDSLTIYVSDSDGNDANDGLSPQTAKKTLAAGASMMRDDFPDHLLLKRGDTFVGQQIRLVNGWDGRSSDEPWLISAYGSGARPVIDSQNLSHGIQVWDCDFIAVIGLHLEPTRDQSQAPPTAPVGMNFYGGNQYAQPCNDVLVEDCYIGGYATNLSFNGQSNEEEHTDVVVRRNVIVDSWNTVGHAQGMYVDHVNGLLIEDNLFDHNGWHESIAGAEATIFNHSMYITHYNRDVTIRNNVSSRASSMGLKFQPNDGTHYITNNIFVRNGYALQIGGGQAAQQVGHAGATIYANDNVIIEAVGNGASQSPGLGVTVTNVKAGSFSNNIIANRLSNTNQFSLSIQDGMGWESMGVGVRNFEVVGNTIYNWRGPIQVVQPTQSYQGGPIPVMENIEFRDNQIQETRLTYSGRLLTTYTSASGVNSFEGGNYYRGAGLEAFSASGTAMTFSNWVATTGETDANYERLEYVDPLRTVSSYAASLGLNSYSTFMNQAHLQSRANWDERFTSQSIGDYIRAGFEPDTEGVEPLPSPSIDLPPQQATEQGGAGNQSMDANSQFSPTVSESSGENHALPTSEVKIADSAALRDRGFPLSSRVWDQLSLTQRQSMLAGLIHVTSNSQADPADDCYRPLIDSTDSLLSDIASEHEVIDCAFGEFGELFSSYGLASEFQPFAIGV